MKEIKVTVWAKGSREEIKQKLTAAIEALPETTSTQCTASLEFHAENPDSEHKRGIGFLQDAIGYQRI